VVKFRAEMAHGNKIGETNVQTAGWAGEDPLEERLGQLFNTLHGALPAKAASKA